MKKLTGLAVAGIFSFLPLGAFELPFFSGCTGFLGDVSAEPDFSAQAFFAGQMDLSGMLLLHADFCVDTAALDLLERPGRGSPNALFSVQELSATISLNGTSTAHFLSAFLGEYEPVGSDVFLRRHFGIQPVLPPVMESWHGMNGASAYPSYGLGASYVLHKGQSFAAGAYLYRNEDAGEAADNTKRSFDIDARIALVRTDVTLDLRGGVSLLYKDKYDSAGSLKPARTSLHAGGNLLLGKRHTNSLFLQAGVSDLQLGSADGTKSKSVIYFFAEQRVLLASSRLHVSVFSLPFTSQDSLLHISYLPSMAGDDDYAQGSVGANVSLVADGLRVGNTAVTAGGHVTFAAMGTSPTTLVTHLKDGTWKPRFSITPFASVPLMGGTLSSSLTLNLPDLFSGSASERADALHLRLGFKTQL